jgi:very-short-patch-repair endonuclease
VESIDPAMAGKTTPLGVAARIAGAQHGVVARRQLVRSGLTSSAIEHMLAAGRLLPLYRGVYAVGHRPVGPRSREMAVVLLAGPTGALACESSAGLWAMTRPWHGPVHALGPKSRSGASYVIHVERDLRRLLRQHGLPQPISNGFVCGYEVDLHWPEHRLVAELDGYTYHHPRRGFETDRERDIVLAAAGGQTVRVTDRQLNRTRAETAARFGLLLSSRAR